MKFGRRHLSENSACNVFAGYMRQILYIANYIPIFKSQKGSMKAVNFLAIIYLIDYTVGFITDTLHYNYLITTEK